MKTLRSLLCTAFAILCTTNAVAKGVSLQTDQEKFSYAVGIQIVQSLIRQGVDIDPDAFNMALRDALDGSSPRLSPEDMAAALGKGESSVSEGLRERAKANLAAGKAFLAENKEKEGVVALSSGLQYKVLRPGAGAFPKSSDKVKVHYAGTLIDGREFDSSKRRGEPATFGVNQVVKGWQEALPLMRVGSRWQVFIPPHLAYGAKGAGAVIGPNATLVFEIELLDIVE